MKNEKDLQRLLKSILQQQDVGLSIRDFHAYLEQHASNATAAEVSEIEQTYGMMKDFMQKGVVDANRDALYQQLLQRLYACAANCQTKEIQQLCGFVSSDDGLSVDDVRRTLESYVQEQAMLSLSGSEEQQKALEKQHFDDQERLFKQVLFSRSWKKNVGDGMATLILSPTISQIDALLLTSAVSVACINVFDVQKFACLVRVYRESTDEELRQRALVGWALASSDRFEIYNEWREQLQALCNEKYVRRDLLELEMQRIYCANADADNEQIQREIIPQLLKNNNVKLNDFGMIEINEENNDDLLHPEAAEQAMEDLEETVQKMHDLQQSGVDIYFGGFSQMKRFPFFYSMVNWFYPFTPQHPMLEDVRRKLLDSKFLEILFERGPFCQSDKYSFALALGSVLDRIPENMREMLNSDETIGATVSEEEQKKPAYLRRIYLQDLYRFYRLNQHANAFRNPFVLNDLHRQGFPFVYGGFPKESLRDEALQLGNFLLKHKKSSHLSLLVKHYARPLAEEDRVGMLLLQSKNAMNYQDPIAALPFLKKAYALEPENEQVLKDLARCSFAAGQYDEAASHYAALTDLHPEKKSYMLYRAITLIAQKKYDESAQILFELDYEKPNSAEVMSALIYTLLWQEKLAQAKKYAERLVDLPKTKAKDLLYAAYAFWFAGDVKQTLVLLNRCSHDKQPLDVRQRLQNDRDLLALYGKSDVDCKLLLDLLA